MLKSMDADETPPTPVAKKLESMNILTQASRGDEEEIDLVIQDTGTTIMENEETTFQFWLRILSCGCISPERNTPFSDISSARTMAPADYDNSYSSELKALPRKSSSIRSISDEDTEQQDADDQKRFEQVVMQYHKRGMTLPKILNHRCALLGYKPKSLANKKILVLDLDETLVHSSFKKVPEADIVVHVEIENILAPIYVRKRPGVDEFLKQVGQLFEVIIFTASMSKYANPLIDKLDVHNSVHWRLFRDHCTFHGGYYKKDLNLLGRDPSQTIIIDNSPICYELQPDNAIAITSWFDNPRDNELMSILPWLHKASQEEDVYSTLRDLRQFRQRWVQQ